MDIAKFRANGFDLITDEGEPMELEKQINDTTWVVISNIVGDGGNVRIESLYSPWKSHCGLDVENLEDTLCMSWFTAFITWLLSILGLTVIRNIYGIPRIISLTPTLVYRF